MTKTETDVIVGIDTHADTHHVGLITNYGKHLDDREFLAVGSGYRDIVKYITSHGPVAAVGIEGTGSYGAELARVLATEGFQVREVNRPNRAHRRLRGKSDPIDAYQAAEAALAERGTSVPKSRDGYVEALRVLRTARTSALKARTAVLAQISGTLTSAPEAIRAKYRGQTSEARVKAMAASRPGPGDPADPSAATTITLKRMGLRHRYLSEEIAEIDTEVEAIVSAHAQHLLEVNGVRAVVASQLLVTVGDNPERLDSEAAFAALTGTAPVPASSGKITRHRLSRGGDRAANSAVHRIVLVRMSKDQRTRDYVARRTAEGKDKLEIMRCLKRYVSREIYRVLHNPRPRPAVNDLRPRRQALGYTQVQVAQHLGTWPTAISRIERAKSRDRDLLNRYRQWLDDKDQISS